MEELKIMDIIEAIKYFFLGIVQGITEVLPVSSSGHTEIVKALFNMNFGTQKPTLFLILLNTGSLVTFIIIYFKRLVRLIVDFVIYIFKKDRRTETKANFIYFSKILVGTIPAGIVGILFRKTLDNWLSEYGLLLVGIGLLFTSTVLIAVSQRPFHNKSYEFSWTDTILIGVAQSVAIVPGVSRSGMTTSMALHRDAGVDSALNFSFLLYIPVSIASLLLLIYEGFKNGLGVPGSSYYGYYLLAFIGAVIFTYVAYRLIFSIFRSGKLKYFGYYCLFMGVGSIIWFVVH
jgi:undecaprenyl-diphosphatase